MERYLLLQMLRPVVSVFFVVLIIVLAFYFSSYLADAVVQRLSIGAVARLAMLKVGLFLDVLIPSAIFLGIVMGLGRLQAGHEVIAIAAAGVGRGRIVRSVLALALVGLLIVAGLSHVFRPWAFDLLYRMEAEMVAQVDLSRVEPGRFEIGDEQWMIFAERRDGDALGEVLVHQRLPTYRNVLRAERLEQRDGPGGTIALDFIGDVRFYRLEQGGDADLVSRSDTLTVLLDPPPPVERERQRRALPLPRLLRAAGPLEWGELQWRTLMPLTVLLLAITALAVAPINPRSGKTGKLITASLVVALYFSTLGMLANRVDSATIPIWPGLFWLPLVLVPLLAVRFWLRWRGPGGPL
ncbi:MAG: LptF/LptG family permease [Wenzhouxiangellaceae bacterium]|nr:LptF/LptG family permease [Wenzhouxiangellaceae bacterium]